MIALKSFLSNSRLTYLTILFIFVTAILDFGAIHDQHFSYLAGSFLQGKLYFIESPGGWGDTAPFQGHNFWPLGPFPAILLAPFVYIFSFFNLFFYQEYLQIFLVLLVFYLVYKIARKFTYLNTDSLFLAFAFTFASVFLGVAISSGSWYFAHVVATALLFLTLYEYLGKGRYALMGILFSLAITTRLSIIPGALFFIFEALLDPGKASWKKLRDVTSFSIPILSSLMLLALYNYARFGSPIEQGYSYQILGSDQTLARQYGLLSLMHIPGNLYYFLLSTPFPVFKDGISHVLQFPYLKVDRWGMSIFITSPYFLYLFFLRYRDRLSKILLGTCFSIAVLIFLFFAIGVHQFGYRYSLDFLPFLFLLLIKNYHSQHKTLSFGFKLIIILTAFSNLYLFFSTFFAIS